jgi:hypothetical protein
VLPLAGECERGHPFVLDEDDLAEKMELLPGEDLIRTIADVVNGHLPGYRFDPDREGFVVRGPNLVYYPDKGEVRDSEKVSVTTYNVTQHIETVIDSKIVGVNAG